MAELKIKAKNENLEYVIAFIEDEMSKTTCSMPILMKIELSIEELFINVASYAYEEGDGDAIIRIEIFDNPDRAVFTLIDNGTPYNPLTREDPDVTLSAENRAIGGLGVFLVKKNMDEYSYEYKNNQNIMTLVKNF